MGMAFGLLSLLITVALILYLMVGTGYTSAVAKQNKVMTSQVNVLSGYDPTRQILATDSLQVRIDRTGGRPKLMVTSVMANGPMADRFDLRPGDQVVQIGDLDVNQNVTTFEDAIAFLHDAYARQWPVTIVRNGQRLALPEPSHVAAIAERDRKATLAAAAATGTPAPTTPAAPATPAAPNPMQQMLDAVRSTPGN